MSQPTEPEFRKRIGYQAMLLAGFCTMATALLMIGNIATKEAIDARQRDDLNASLAQVIPSNLYDNNLLDHPLSLTDANGKPHIVYRGTEGMKISALAYEISGQGYAGEIRLIMGLDSAGKVLGIRVLSHAETPGLGDKIEAERSDWILAFNGLSFGNPPREKWKVKKDGGQFDSFTGATITPRGVLKAIEEGLDFFDRHKTELLSPPAVFEGSAKGG